MAWRRRDVRAQRRVAARVDRRVKRRRRADEARAWRDGVLERALSVLAARWPDRFGAAAARVRDANAMFAELRRIQAHPQPHLVADGKAGADPATDQAGPAAGRDEQNGPKGWTR